MAGLGALTEPGLTEPADSLYARAGRLYAERRFRDAIPLFLQVVAQNPRNGNAFALLGGSYLQLGDYPQAIGAFERSLELDEGIKLAYLGLVASNYFTERMDSSRQWVRRLVPLLTGDERDRYLAMFSAQFPRLDLSGT
ncbi:MAG: tetratricopeptide repeat protein [Gemmatimonadota bacterium]